MHTNSFSSTWRPGLVAVDVFLGPFPALIPADGDPRDVLLPRFSLDVVHRIEQTTLLLANGNGPIVRVVGKHVTLTSISRRVIAQGGQVIAPDGDGRYAVPAPFGQWQEVDDPLQHNDFCDCGDCGCPADCAACESPLGGGHHHSCVWQAGSARWERPAIPAARVVLEAHIHRPGCPWVRRRPGPLFLPGRSQCLFCGTIGACVTHDVITAEGLAHHQYCRDCRQRWSAAAV